MINIDRSKAREMLRAVRDYILRVVVPKDQSAQREIQELFNQLLNLLES